MPQLDATVRNRADLGEPDIAAMYALFASYYADTTEAAFRADLAEKTHAIVLHAGPVLAGFSTLTLIPGDGYRTIFSGDTIIDRLHWGEQGLALAFCQFAGVLKAQQPEVPLYWFLISKGYRTYRYLHLFSRQYWPSYRADPAPALKAVLDAVASKKFGSSYDAGSGIIRFAQSRGHLRPDWATVGDHLRERPEVQFFLDRNPNFAAGEELACITLLEPANLRSVAQRAFLAGLALREAALDDA
jgi:hypothetical protein